MSFLNGDFQSKPLRELLACRKAGKFRDETGKALKRGFRASELCPESGAQKLALSLPRSRLEPIPKRCPEKTGFDFCS